MSAGQSASPSGHQNIIVQVAGDGNTVQVRYPKLTLIPMQNRLRGKPGQYIEILDPAFQAVPLVGRGPDLEYMFNWLATERGIAVTALVGRGGSGKTRLALELLQNLPNGWQGGLLTADEAARFVSQENLADWSWQKPTLVIVDYAALMTEPLAKWFSQLADNRTPSHPLRILLLERHADAQKGWFHDLADDTWHGSAVRDLFSPAEPVRLTPLDSNAQRRELLADGLRIAYSLSDQTRSQPVIPRPDEDKWFDQRLAGEQFADPLLLLMAAVTAVTNGIHSAVGLSRLDLAKALATREQARIRAAVPDRAAKDLLTHLYACVTLCGGTSREDALAIADGEFLALKKQYPSGAGQAVDDLASLLGGNDGLPPMTPDLLAEAFLLVALGERGTAVVGRLASTAPSRIAAILIRTTQDFASAGDRLPLDWLRSLIERGTADLAVLIAIEEALPNQSTIIRQTALDVTNMLIRSLRGLDSHVAITAFQIARLLNNLAIRQSAMGNRAEAVASIAEAVRHYRQLAVANSDAVLPDLTGALNNQANLQSAMGHRAEALASVAEAVRYYRQLAKANPDAFLPNLAMSLNNQANSQSAMGQRAEGLISIAEAVRHHRQLSDANPDAFLPDLAMSLNNQANRQSDMGLRAEALTSIAEAVRHYRHLAEANLDAFLPDLTGALNNQANRQRDMGLRAEALASIAEAVRRYRQLAKANPDAFLPDLTGALNNQATMQSDMGMRVEALASVAEAVSHYRRLAKANPDAFLSNLAMSLNNQANSQSDMGLRAEALASIAEAIRLYRHLAEANPDAFLPNLAMSLNNQAIRQSDMGLRAEALASIAEAIRHYRQLAKANPDAFLPDLSGALNNQANSQSAMGQRAEALASVAEAVSHYRQLAKANPDAFLSNLAMSLNNQANSQSTMGQRAEALASIAEAVRHYRQLAKANPDAFLPDLAMTLNNQANRQSDMGQRAEALASSAEAVRHYRQLTEVNPGAFLPNLAMSLSVLGDCLAATTDISGGRDAAAESLSCLANSFAKFPDAFRGLARATLRDYLMRSQELEIEPDPELLRYYRDLLDESDE